MAHSNLNSCTISGNLTRDVEVVGTNQGIGRLSIANNQMRKNQAGEWEEQVSFFDCALLGARRVSALSPYLTKGAHVTVTGTLEQQTWEDRDGNKRSSVRIVVDQLELGGSAPKQTQAAAPTYAAAPVPAQPQAADVYDDGIPF